MHGNAAVFLVVKSAIREVKSSLIWLSCCYKKPDKVPDTWAWDGDTGSHVFPVHCTISKAQIHWLQILRWDKKCEHPAKKVIVSSRNLFGRRADLLTRGNWQTEHKWTTRTVFVVICSGVTDRQTNAHVTPGHLTSFVWIFFKLQSRTNPKFRIWPWIFYERVLLLGDNYLASLTPNRGRCVG